MNDNKDMDGIQKTVYLRLQELAQKVKDGAYGKDDDFELEEFERDASDITADM